MLKVLVIDDTEVNLEAARRHFADTSKYDLTTCATHKEGVNLLCPKYDEEKLQALQMEYKSKGMPGYYRQSYEDSKLPYWDVVLCDLNMPAHGEGKLVGQVMMVGWQMALIAAKNGAKYVAVVTNGNHHQDLTSGMFDRLGGTTFQDGSPVEFVINGAKVGFWHDPEEYYGPNEAGIAGKDWGRVLARLMRE